MKIFNLNDKKIVKYIRKITLFYIIYYLLEFENFSYNFYINNNLFFIN